MLCKGAILLFLHTLARVGLQHAAHAGLESLFLQPEPAGRLGAEALELVREVALLANKEEMGRLTGWLEGATDDSYHQNFVTGTEKAVAVVRESPHGPPLINPPAWSAPILSHGLLYLRGADRLVCLRLTGD